MEEGVPRGHAPAAYPKRFRNLFGVMQKRGDETDHHRRREIQAERQAQTLQGGQQALHPAGKGQRQDHVQHRRHAQERHHQRHRRKRGHGRDQQAHPERAPHGQQRHAHKDRIPDQQDAELPHPEGIHQRHAEKHHLRLDPGQGHRSHGRQQADEHLRPRIRRVQPAAPDGPLSYGQCLHDAAPERRGRRKKARTAIPRSR